MTVGDMKQDGPKAGGSGVRGISYPAIPLEAAVKRTQQLWQHEHKNSAPMEAVAAHWGYSPTSSGLRTTVAALLSFGLVTDKGSGKHREIQVSPLGLDIILDTPERQSALRKAVTGPKIYADLLESWPASNLPSDQSLKVYLLRHKNFNPKAVDGFIKDFKDSIDFSGLAKAATVPEATAGVSEAEEMQVELTGAHATAVAGQLTPLAGQSHGTSERNWLSGSVSKDTHFRLLVSGDIGPKEIGKLIKLLEAQKAVLDDET